MDVILLCGGFGTRMEPIGSFIPKALLPVKGRPMIDHILEDLKSYKDVARIIIDTNQKFADQFEYYINSKTSSGFSKRLELLVEPTLHNGEKLGSIKGVEFVLKSARVESDFMVIFGDNYFDFGLGAIISRLKETGNAAIGLYETDSMDLLTRSGVVSLEGDRIVELEEKPTTPKTNLLSTGIYAFPKGSDKLFQEYINGENNPDSMGYFIKWLVKKTETHGVKCKGIWIDIGTVDAYRKVFESNQSQ
ncbi:MAG: nucleotidyltransferase family protein [Candidatus Micrarchaeales archaeon]